MFHRSFLKLLMYLFFALVAYVSKAQDLHFAQYNFAQTMINPANMGNMRQDFRVSMIHRAQWFQASAPFHTTGFCGDVKLKWKRFASDYWSVGAFFLNDEMGLNQFTAQQLLGAVSFQKTLGQYDRHKVSLGLQAGPGRLALSSERLLFASQADEFYQFNENRPSGENLGNLNLWRWQIHMGIHHHYQINRKTFLGTGLAVHQLLGAENSFLTTGNYRQKEKVFLTSVFKYLFAPRFAIQPSMMFAWQYGARIWMYGTDIVVQMNDLKTINAVENQNKVLVSLGLYQRLFDAWIVLGKYRSKDFQVAISYEITNSDLRYNQPSTGIGSLPSVEVSFSYFGFFKKEDPRRVIFPCEKYL